MFDIVIPIGPNDVDIIKHQIEYTKKHIIGYRSIYLISYDKSINIDECNTISEDIFPFSLETVSNFHGKLNRNGWYLQQLLKLYAGLIIPDILNTYLVIDSDTFFLKPTTFIEDGKCLYNYGDEYHLPYFEHMQKMHETLSKQYSDKSGICHHMIFETKYIKELFNIIEKKHDDTFYNVFLKNVTQYQFSGASEYEIYFNYIILNHKDNIKIRELKWTNTQYFILNSDYDYISIHHYNRRINT
jgi:hypothetical protein